MIGLVADLSEEAKQAGEKMYAKLMDGLPVTCTLILMHGSVLDHYSSSRNFHFTSTITLEKNTDH